MVHGLLKTTYELVQGILVIQGNESTPSPVNGSDSENDSNYVNISLQFTRYSDGKLFECQLDDQKIQKLHQIFFDTSLILDILDRAPKSMCFFHNKEEIDTVTGPESVPGGICDDRKISESVDFIWEFIQQRAKKTKVFPVSIIVPEKKYPMGSNQQIIELNRLLTCYKQRLSDLESVPSSYVDLESNGLIPKEKDSYQLTMEDMKWLAFSNYGKFTGLNQYFLQFKSNGDMLRQLYPTNAQGQQTDMSQQHVQEWLSQNDFKFNEILLAQLRLNKFMSNRQCELINIRIDNNYHPKISSTGGFTFSDCMLHGYHRCSNPKKPKIYLILRTTDPAPNQYDQAFYPRDAYQPIRDKLQMYPLISKIDENFEKKIAYNSQWVIYKISM